MQVTAQVRQQVIAKLQEGIAIAEAHYGKNFPFPDVTYDVRGTTGGYAKCSKWQVSFNAVLLMQNVEDFIARTVPHELAHLIDYKLNPENFRSGRDYFTGRRTKRDLHGESWRSVMRVLGVSDITRCHSYDTTEARVRTKKTNEVKCGKCPKTFMVTDKMYNQLVANPYSRYHPACGRRSGLFPTEAQRTHVVEKAAAVQKADAELVQKAPAAGSKLDKCWLLYKSWNHNYDRKGMLAVFVNEAGCTPAGAATYYATCKRKYEAGVI